MTIVSSTAAAGHAQKDGRRYVQEIHTDHLGAEHRYEYLAAQDADIQSILTTRAGALAILLAEREYREHIETDGWSALEHQTGAQFAARFRAEYQSASKARCAYLAWWIIRRLANGDVTDAGVRNAFGMTVTQYNAFKARMQTLHDHWAAVLAATGE